MPVTYLELENFKSYAGVQRIGPFKDFTSVIGPNGAGKSNLMDAISFVFGVQSRELRSNQMKDLIFRAPGTQQQKRLRASATIIYQDTVTEEETHYSRTISPTGVGDYRVNGSIVTFKEYEAALAEIGVLLKARNFLVFQGDVESIARKTPKEFVELLENISGSAELKEPYEEAMKAKDEAEAGQLFLYNKQKGFKNERRILKEQKEEAERFHAILEEKSKLQTDMYLWLLHHLHQDMKEREDAVEELSTEMGDLEKQEHVASQQLKQCKKQASAARRETAVADKKRIQLSAALDKLEPAVIQATEEIKDLIKKVATDEKQLQKLNSDAEKHSSTLATLDEDINEYKKTRKQLEIGYAKIKRGATDDVTLTEEQEAEYDRVREAAAAASDEPRRVLTALNRKLEAARAKAATKLSEYNDVKSRHEEVVGDVKDFTDRKEKLTKVGYDTSLSMRNFILGSLIQLVSHSRVSIQLRLTLPLPRKSFNLHKNQHKKLKLAARNLTRRSKRLVLLFAMFVTTTARERTKTASFRRLLPLNVISLVSKVALLTFAVPPSDVSILPSQSPVVKIWTRLLLIPSKLVLIA